MSTTEEKKLCELVDAFAAQMKEKLLKKKGEGWTGWRERRYRENIRYQLQEHLARAIFSKEPWQFIDVANLAAFLWHQEGRPKA